MSTQQTFDLLTPDIHLTKSCWKDFREMVHSHLGWTANRRLATQVLRSYPSSLNGRGIVTRECS